MTYAKSKELHQFKTIRLWEETVDTLLALSRANKESLAATAKRVVDAYQKQQESDNEASKPAGA